MSGNELSVLIGVILITTGIILQWYTNKKKKNK